MENTTLEKENNLETGNTDEATNKKQESVNTDENPFAMVGFVGTFRKTTIDGVEYASVNDMIKLTCRLNQDSAKKTLRQLQAHHPELVPNELRHGMTGLEDELRHGMTGLEDELRHGMTGLEDEPDHGMIQNESEPGPGMMNESEQGHGMSPLPNQRNFKVKKLNLRYFKFTGRGQQDTLVADAETLIYILMILPSKRVIEFRMKAAEVFVRYLKGDESLIAEMRGNNNKCAYPLEEVCAQEEDAELTNKKRKFAVLEIDLAMRYKELDYKEKAFNTEMDMKNKELEFKNKELDYSLKAAKVTYEISEMNRRLLVPGVTVEAIPVSPPEKRSLAEMMTRCKKYTVREILRENKISNLTQDEVLRVGIRAGELYFAKYHTSVPENMKKDYGNGNKANQFFEQDFPIVLTAYRQVVGGK